MQLQEIGRVKLVQIQRASLKAGERPHRYYDPAPLLAVDALVLDEGGCAGLPCDGSRLLDVHHAQHPGSKNQAGLNGISIGFTGHYRQMRERFGEHIADGVAGENILVEADRSFALDDLGAAVVIRLADGTHARLTDLLVAAPCVEFSRFVNLGADPLTADELRATLQFLDGGRRGFYARMAPRSPDALVRPGDRVFIEERER